MSKEKTLSKMKMSVKEVIVIILLVVLTISIISGFALYREHKMRRAVVSFEGVSFDGMLFEPCTDYAFTNTLELSGIICKSEDGDWRIFSVEGYEKNLEYIRAQSFINGHWYERAE